MSDKTDNKNTTCRDILLSEYKTCSFDLHSKLQTFPESGKKYLPLNERIKMFVADNPNGSIECRVLADNNIFASIEAKITTDSGNIAVAVGKWYHSNTDSYGMNYVKTAQSNAVSSALKYLGYDYTEEVEAEPDGSLNKGDIFILDDNQEYIPNPSFVPVAPKKQTNKTVRTEITVEQAKSTVMTGPPFNGMKIADILATKNQRYLDELKNRLVFAVQQGTTLAPIARVILPLMEE